MHDCECSHYKGIRPSKKCENRRIAAEALSKFLLKLCVLQKNIQSVTRIWFIELQMQFDSVIALQTTSTTMNQITSSGNDELTVNVYSQYNSCTFFGPVSPSCMVLYSHLARLRANSLSVNRKPTLNEHLSCIFFPSLFFLFFFIFLFSKDFFPFFSFIFPGIFFSPLILFLQQFTQFRVDRAFHPSRQTFRALKSL